MLRRKMSFLSNKRLKEVLESKQREFLRWKKDLT